MGNGKFLLDRRPNSLSKIEDRFSRLADRIIRNDPDKVALLLNLIAGSMRRTGLADEKMQECYFRILYCAAWCGNKLSKNKESHEFERSIANRREQSQVQ